MDIQTSQTSKNESALNNTQKNKAIELAVAAIEKQFGKG